MNMPKISIDDMEHQVARFENMKGSDLAFMNQWIPGHEREIVNIIGCESMAAAPYIRMKRKKSSCRWWGRGRFFG